MKEYYISRDKVKRGPFTFDELLNHVIFPDTLICTQRTGWKRAIDIEDLNCYFAVKQTSRTRTKRTPEIAIVNNSNEDMSYVLLKSFCMLLILLFVAQIVHTIGG